MPIDGGHDRKDDSSSSEADGTHAAPGGESRKGGGSSVGAGGRVTGSGDSTSGRQVDSPGATDASTYEGGKSSESNRSRSPSQDGDVPTHDYAAVNPGETAPAGNSGTRLEAHAYAAANSSETDLATGAGKTADSQTDSPRANDADRPEGGQALESTQSRPPSQGGEVPTPNYAAVNPGESALAGDGGTRLEANQFAPVNSGETDLASTAQQIADTPQTSGAQTSGEVAAIAENARDDARLLSADASQKEAGDVSTVSEGAPSVEAQEPPEALNSTGERDPASGARGVAEPYPADLPGTAGAGQSDKPSPDDTVSGQSLDTTGDNRQTAADVASTLQERAALAERTVTPALQEVAASTGGEMVGLEHRLKGTGSLTDKVERIMDERVVTPEKAGEYVTDSLRYTMTYSPQAYSEGLNNALGRLSERGHQVGDVKNTWAEGSSYKGINVSMKDPGGQPFELQFHTPESFQAKMDSHHLYELERDPNVAEDVATEVHATMVERCALLTHPLGVESIGTLVRR